MILKEAERLRRFKQSAVLVNGIIDLLGLPGNLGYVAKTILNLDRTVNKSQIDRMQKITEQLGNGTFSLLRRVAKNPRFKELKNRYKFTGKTKIEFLIEMLDKKTGKLKMISLSDLLKKLYKSAEEDEFYEENKEFFQKWGGGTKENRENEEYVREVRALKKKFRKERAKMKSDSVLKEFFGL